MTDGAGVPTGTPLSDPPLVAAISEDPLLRNVKLIAEAWDCDGLYQVCNLCVLLGHGPKCYS
jgi:isoamylase